MAEKISIWAEGAPQPFGHYTQALKFGNTIHISGQLPLDPQTNRPVAGDIEAQSRQVLNNIAAILQACGGQLSNLLSTTVYLTDLRDFPVFDKVTKEFFFFLPPTRTTVMVSALPGGSKICISGVAELPPSDMGGGPKKML
jgi:2-iminobutanoate/2-iminopropanoate deaminase